MKQQKAERARQQELDKLKSQEQKEKLLKGEEKILRAQKLTELKKQKHEKILIMKNNMA